MLSLKRNLKEERCVPKEADKETGTCPTRHKETETCPVCQTKSLSPCLRVCTVISPNFR